MEFNAGIISGKLPLNGLLIPVPMLPCPYSTVQFSQGGLSGDPGIGWSCTQFYLRYGKPSAVFGRIMDFQPLG
jgi:hypothetical protein